MTRPDVILIVKKLDKIIKTAERIVIHQWPVVQILRITWTLLATTCDFALNPQLLLDHRTASGISIDLLS